MGDDFLSIITDRHSKRAFLDRPVPRGLLERVLTAAGNAPSTRNTQFWQVAVLTGAARDELSRRLCVALDSGERFKPDYANRPEQQESDQQKRSFDWGSAFYGTMGIGRNDHDARREFERENLRFYSAPAAMVFHLPRNAVAGTFLEMGFFLQNVMLGLVACDLGSCPQFSVARYGDVIRGFLGLGADRLVVCSLSVGHVDEGAPINRFLPERAKLHEYTQWYDGYPPPAADSGE